MTDKQTLFADGILEASVNFGVARITLAQTGSDGKPVPSGQLMLPVVQLPSFTNGLMTLLKQIETKVKEQQAQQGIAAAAEATNKADSVPSAFRFSGS